MISFRESVRARPGMYLGSNESKGIINLLCGLFSDSIAILQTDQLNFSITICGNGKIIFQIEAVADSSQLQRQLTAYFDKDFYYLQILSEVTKRLSVTHVAGNFQLSFQLDNAVFPDTAIDYNNLLEKFFQLALLNRNSEILLRDETKKYHSQNYYSFPDGVFYLYNNIRREVLGKPVFEVYFDDEFKGYKYQIVIAYRTDWYPSPFIASFGNDTNTIRGGDLVNGIIEGLYSATKKHVLDNELSSFKIKKKKFYNGLIIVCSVRGGQMTFGGSFKETLDMPDIKKQSKKIVQQLVMDYLANNPDKVDEVLWRFDEKEITSRMY